MDGPPFHLPRARSLHKEALLTSNAQPTDVVRRQAPEVGFEEA